MGIVNQRTNSERTGSAVDSAATDPLAALERDLGVAPEVERWRRKLLEPRNDCVLLGPAGSGKTSLLGSLARACEVATADLELRLVPLGSLPSLIGDLARHLSGEAVLPLTSVAITHRLQLELRGRTLGETVVSSVNPRFKLPRDADSRSLGREFEITIQDTPGGALFDSIRSWDSATGPVGEILDEACVASWLVLCVDAVNPRPALWQAAVPQLVARLAAATDRLVLRGSSEHVAGAGDYPALTALERKLPQQRVLVLLTKIDQVCADVLACVRNSRELRRDRRLREIARLGSDDLARRLDPLPTVHSALGGGALGMLRAALPEGAQVAVGVVSALGFPQAREGAALSSLGTASAVRGFGDPLQAWQPFGLREALVFLATGRCMHPVTPIDAIDALAASSGQLLELPGEELSWPSVHQPQPTKSWNQETEHGR